MINGYSAFFMGSFVINLKKILHGYYNDYGRSKKMQTVMYSFNSYSLYRPSMVLMIPSLPLSPPSEPSSPPPAPPLPPPPLPEPPPAVPSITTLTLLIEAINTTSPAE